MPKPLETLVERFPEIEPLDYYRAIFPAELMEERGKLEDGKYNGIAIQLREDGKARRVHITRELEQISEMLESQEFLMVAPVLFAGKQANIQNARWLTALEFDLDFLRVKGGEVVGLDALFFYAGITEGEPYETHRIPRPTYIILSSERNLHVVYLLEKPLAMYQNVVKQVRAYRKAIIPKLWKSYVTDAYENPQFETSPVQAFRLVGSKTKQGKDKVRCFLTGEPLRLEELNSYVPEDSRITTKALYSKHSLEEAKELYPEWYKHRIEENLPPRTWQAHRGLYDWWKNRLPEIEVGHRYFYLLCMASFAVKCGISEEELLEDMAQARRVLDMISPEDNPLTLADMAKAAQAYQEKYRMLTRATISRLCGVEIQASKRNGRPQELHLSIARSTLALLNKANGEALQGSPSRKKDVLSYFQDNPKASISQAARDLDASRYTVRKWIHVLMDEGKLESWKGANRK